MSQLRTLTDINTSQPSPHCSTNFSLSSSSVLLKKLWAEIVTDTDSWASCHWSIPRHSSLFTKNLPKQAESYKHQTKQGGKLKLPPKWSDSSFRISFPLSYNVEVAANAEQEAMTQYFPIWECNFMHNMQDLWIIDGIGQKNETQMKHRCYQVCVH